MKNNIAALRQSPGQNGTSFHGCIRNLYINSELQDFRNVPLQVGILPGCEPCHKKVCVHGTCHATSQSGFSCECEGGWTGPLCDQQTNDPCLGNKYVLPQENTVVSYAHKSPVMCIACVIFFIKAHTCKKQHNLGM